MRRAIFLVALMICVLGVSAVSATECNYDITNTGDEDAFDVAVVLPGNVTFTEFWNNLGDGDPTITTSGGNKIVHWETTPPRPIRRGDTVHFGFTTTSGGCPCIDIYWTDRCHNRIHASYVGTAENHLTGTSFRIRNTSSQPIRVENPVMACQTAALPLAALNADNEYLATALAPIGGSVDLAPGQSVEFPVNPCDQCYCVTRFETAGPGLGARLSAYAQQFVGVGAGPGGK